MSAPSRHAPALRLRRRLLRTAAVLALLAAGLMLPAAPARAGAG